MHRRRKSNKGRRRENGKERGSEFVGRGIEKRGREILRRIMRRGVTRERGGARLMENKCAGLREREVENSSNKRR